MKNITVIGGGTMGNGIAHVFAVKDYKVNLVDVSERALERALATIEKNLDRMVKKELIDNKQKAGALNNITTKTAIEGAVEKADLIIEAATENVDIKLGIFRTLNRFANENAILATNTSAISITKIAAATDNPENVIGMHFMNPVPVMKLIEIINGYSTSQSVTQKVTDVAKSLGKIPVVANDYPGFVANRILMPMMNEAVISLQEGVAGVEEIDTILKLGMAHPMGPLQLADFIGLDVCLHILNVLYDGLGKTKYAPCPLLKNMVAAGKNGVKSGEGFYVYKPGSKELVVSNTFK